VLNGDRVCVGIEIWQRLVFRGPAAEDFEGVNELASFVVELKYYVFAEFFERDFGAESGAQLPVPGSPIARMRGPG
jgi:hypothetical protein